jgi:hypothetical protein
MPVKPCVRLRTLLDSAALSFKAKQGPSTKHGESRTTPSLKRFGILVCLPKALAIAAWWFGCFPDVEVLYFQEIIYCAPSAVRVAELVVRLSASLLRIGSPGCSGLLSGRTSGALRRRIMWLLRSR